MNFHEDNIIPVLEGIRYGRSGTPKAFMVGLGIKIRPGVRITLGYEYGSIIWLH